MKQVLNTTDLDLNFMANPFTGDVSVKTGVDAIKQSMKTILFLQKYEKPTVIPEPSQLQYTMVLTKQSALFNAWKEMNRVANEYDIPFRCVTQWATHQTGKLYDTLGVKLDIKPESLNSNELLIMAASSQSAEQSESKPPSTRKRVTRGKKLCAK